MSEALGVGVTTIKRWVDEGILPAHRTPGGHRKILLADMLRIVREGHFPRNDLNRIHLPAEVTADPKSLRLRLFAALKHGRGDAVRSLLEDAYHAGLAIEVLADTVIAPAMSQLGHDWEKGRLDVLYEHRGTQLCTAALYGLKGRLDVSARVRRPVAIGGGPEGDPYTLANLLAEMVLIDAGWDVINFGPNTPLSSLRQALRDFRPRLLWVSVSSLQDSADFLKEYQALYKDAAHAGTAVAVGGRALTEPVRANMPYTTFGDRLSHLGAFARTLHPRPRQPRRGRPRGTVGEVTPAAARLPLRRKRSRCA
jgi:excisionase family DNA binding protein